MSAQSQHSGIHKAKFSSIKHYHNLGTLNWTRERTNTIQKGIYFSVRRPTNASTQGISYVPSNSRIKFRPDRDRIYSGTLQITRKTSIEREKRDFARRKCEERRDRTISVLVEQAERLLELGDLVVCELIRHLRAFESDQTPREKERGERSERVGG